MANQVTVSNDHSINVTIEPPANVQVLVSRAVIGTVANVASANTANYANFANYAGNVTVSAQPNITSLGTLTSLTSSGNITAPFFIGNIVGNISGNITVPGSNTAVLFNQTGNAGASDALKFDYASNILTANGNIVANYFIGNGSQLTNVNAVTSNIANTANSVAVANVVGIGNIAVINLDGNLSNILYGNGIFAQVPNVSNVANANFANFAGNAFSVSGSNVSGAVANATYANTSGSATTAGTVTTNAQPNITSVGILTSLVVAGNITPSSNITYSLGNNTNRFNNLYLAGNTIILGDQTISANATGISVSGNLSGDASGLSNIAGANVTGQVSNALISGTVYTNAQPNITSVGTLTSANISGDALVAGNLTVGGNISYVNVNNLVVQDPVIELGGGPNGAPLTTNDGKDRGTLLHYYTTQPIDAFMGWDNGNGEFAFGSNVTNNLDVMTFNTLGNVRAQTFLGNLTGLASSATVAASANAVAGANVSGTVANATYATNAGTSASANSVAGANVSGAVSFATTANSVALANVSGAGNIASINLDGNVSNVLSGNGSFVALPTVSANSNYANFAGNVVNSSQSNITSLGNLTGLTINNTVGTAPTLIFAPNGTSFTTNYAPSAGTTQVGQSSRSGTGTPANAVIRTRGTISSPLTVGTSDTVNLNTYYAYNGNTNALAATYTIRLAGSGTLNTGANAVYTGATHSWQTGNPWGDWSNISAISGLNTLTFNTQGTLLIAPGARRTSGADAGSIRITDYGTVSGAQFAGGINIFKARGNADATLSVQPDDDIGSFTFTPDNGVGTTAAAAGLFVKVDSSYVANTANVPLNFVIGAVNSSNTAVYSSFYGNGTASFPGLITTSSNANVGGLNVTGISSLGNVGNVKITGGTANYVLKTDGTGNLDWVAQSGGGGTPGGSNTELQFNNNGTFGGISTVTWNGSNISLGAVGNVKITGGVNNEVMRTDGTGNLSFSSIAQTLLVGTRAGPYTVPITNYTFQVTTRSSGNVTVYVN